MRVLIVYAHPEPRSFNAALRDAAIQVLTERGHEVRVSDLYAMEFQAVGGHGDFTSLPVAGPFDYMAEQARASQRGTFSPELRQEMERLRWADLLLLQFPLWWFSMPAILKGWVDRVLAMGVAYDIRHNYESGPMRGKRALLSVTTGSPEFLFQSTGKLGTIEDILHPIHWGILSFVGMDVLSPFVSYAIAHATPDERAAQLDTYRQYLVDLDKKHPLELGPLPPSALRNGASSVSDGASDDQRSDQ